MSIRTNKNTTKFPSMQQLNNYLQQFKQECELRIMFKVSTPTIKKLKTNGFSSPQNFFLSKADDNLSVSTADTASKPEPELEISQFQPPKPDYSTLISKSLENGHKKFTTVSKAVELFEEKCLVSKAMNKAELIQFRKCAFSYLEKVAEKYEIFTHQHADSVILALLFLVVDRIGFSKKKFLRNVDLVCKKKCTKLSTIKKSKCFGYMKAIIA